MKVQKKISVTICLLPLLFGLVLGGAPQLTHASCVGCETQVTALKKAKSAQVTYEDLMQRNKQFLDGPDGQDPSKSIKVKSNILILQLKIDTEKNNVLASQQEITAKCPSCTTQTQ
jgi:hypothetical protein